jgi:Flp pilus assembly protein TadD
MPPRKPTVGFACIAILSFALTPLRHTVPETSGLLGLATKEVQAKDFLAALRHLRTLLATDPDSAEAYNLTGVCEVSLGDYAAAESAFQKSVSLDPHFPAAHVNLGELMLRMHKERAALTQFEAALAVDTNALTQDSQSYQGFNLVGLCLMDEHKYEAASRAFAHSLRINPHYAPAYANLGLALVALNDDSGALQTFFSALKLSPQDPVVISNIGLIYARQRKFADALTYLRQVYALTPNDTNVTAALAAAEIECGRSDEAEALIDDLARSGRLTSLMRASLAASWLQKNQAERALPLVEGNPELAARFYGLGCETAEALIEENHALAAVHLLEAIRVLRAPDAAYYALLGSAYYSLDRPKQASYNFQQAIRLDPSDTEDYFKLGMIFLKYHTYKPAIYVFQTALRSQPQSPKLWLGLGISCYFASNIAGGEQALRKAIRLAPDSAVAYVVLGDLLEQTGRFVEAAANFQQAIHLQPHSFAPYYYYGSVTARLGGEHLNKAIAGLRQAILLNPTFAEAHYELGKCLAEQGQTSEAVKELRASLELKPDLARSHYQLGRIFQKIGKTALARQQFRLFAAASEKQHSHDLIRRLIVQIGEPQK